MPVVLQTRGAGVEAAHPFVAVVVQDRRVARAFDAPGVEASRVTTTWRSASKPFQLAQALAALGPLAEGLTAEDLALGAASHSGEARHVERVHALLRRFGSTPADLRCGAHPPVHAPTAEALYRAGGEVSAVHNNCSGKHAFMLGACRAQGWSLEYRPLEHPLQQRNRAGIEALCEAQGIAAVDGCGVPTWHMPLEGLARAWSRLAESMTAELDALGRIGRAMAAHPDLTSGTDRLDADVVRGFAGPLAVKIGAQGVFCIAEPNRGVGIAIKVLSGCGEALPAAIAHVLSALMPGAFSPPEPWGHLHVRNVVGDVVGGFEVA